MTCRKCGGKGYIQEDYYWYPSTVIECQCQRFMSIEEYKKQIKEKANDKSDNQGESSPTNTAQVR